ncbi:MAG: hypothetical protein EB084_09265 [Proteobacteria bacterium]|nr:hypothetical protein [Pseudomonadota bacterium]
MEINSRLTLETFQQNLNTTFRAYLKDADAIDLTLVGARHIKRDSLQDIFSVAFRGPADRALEQGTYQLDHTRMGAFQIFVVPYKNDQGFVFYEATFNRLLRPLRID